MSLEAAILENTAVLRQLIAVLQTPAATSEPVDTAMVYAQQKAIHAEPPFTPAEAKAAATAVLTEVANKPAEVTPATDAAASTTESTAPAASYEDITATVRRLISAGKRELVVEALKQFNCTKASELKPEAYDDFLASVASVEEAQQ